MNKEKWYQLYNESVRKHNSRMLLVTSVDDWNEAKQCILKLVKEVDEATEVYNMENSKSGRQ